jgi:hypothetical protein
MKGAIQANLIIFVLCLVGCRPGSPERVIAQVDITGKLTFVFSRTGRPAVLDTFTMRRSANGEVVCVVEATPPGGGTSSMWRFGEKLGNGYKVEGCDVAPGAGVYRVEFRAHNYGQAFAYGVCDLCVDSDGKVSFGKTSCSKGMCKSVEAAR